MKKLLYSAVALLCFMCTNSFSQTIQNAGMEDWSIKKYFDEAPPFSSTNLISYLSNGVTTLTKSTDAHGGNYAALLTVDSIEGTGNNIGGMLFLGDLGAGVFAIKGGYPYNGKPDSLTGYIKFDIAVGDTATLLVGFKSSGMTIGYVQYNIAGSQATYKRFSIPFTYFNPFATPDSLVAAVFISQEEAPAKNKLYIDDLNFTKKTGTVPAFPNGDFETWNSISSKEPDHWATSNLYTLGDGASVKDTTDSHSGNLAARIENLNTFFDDDNPMGFLINGRLGEDGPTGGQPVTAIPKSLNGYYKYFPKGNDSAIAIVHFSKWNSSTMESDSVAEFGIVLPASSTYKAFTISIPDFTGAPDSVLIGFAPSNFSDTLATPTLHSKLLIDDLSFGISTGLSVPLSEYFKENILYPNPATETVTLSYQLNESGPVTVKIYDVNGKVVKVNTIGENSSGEHQVTLNVKDLPDGVYFCSFNAGEKQTVKKFTIQR